MNLSSLLALLDIFGLSVGALLGLLTQMNYVTTIPVHLAEVGEGFVVVTQGDTVTLSMTTVALAFEGGAIKFDDLADAVHGKDVIFDIGKTVTSEDFMPVLSEISTSAQSVALGVKESTDSAHLQTLQTNINTKESR